MSSTVLLAPLRRERLWISALPKQVQTCPNFSGWPFHFSFRQRADRIVPVPSDFNMGVSNYNDVPSKPLPHNFPAGNVAIADGTLQLKVNAYDDSGHVNGGEVVTNDKFMYGSLRTVLKSSGVPGVVEGVFFYCETLAWTGQSDVWRVLML